MPKKYAITVSQANEIYLARKQIRDKQVDKRLKAVQLRGEGKSHTEIAEQLETSTDMVSRWICAYANGGIDALLPKKRPGRPRNISYEEEESLLKEFEARAQAGQVVEVAEIERAYQEKVGHRIGTGQIYYVLKRHSWFKATPQSKHSSQNRQSYTDIVASKRLTLASAK